MNNDEIIDESTIDEKIAAITHKDSSLKRLDTSFIKHIEAEEYKKSNLLAYWINDFANYHDNENDFSPELLKNFKRGDIIKANLGFNIGNELGGLHYCIVINKKDNKKSGTLNVIPLTSIKENKNYNENFCVNLGDELYKLLNNKSIIIYKNLISDKQTIDDNILELSSSEPEKLNLYLKNLNILKKLLDELRNMKHGSIALVNQITTISKQRIFKTEILNGIKVSNEALNLIDDKIKKMFTK